MKKQIFVREWTAVFLVFILFSSLIIISKTTRIRAKTHLVKYQKNTEEEKIVIELTGAVITPGPYQVRPGTALKMLLKEAGLAKTANRKKINAKKILFSSQKIEIPSKKPPSNIKK